MDKSSSSKVTVEYEDPAGLFPLLKPDLESRLPLRNLNWKSASRPLRNIDALHVEFVPGASAKRDTSLDLAELHRTASVQSSRGASIDSRTRPGPGKRSISHPIGQPLPQRERRHQIPGLRQTPYLKLFLLRCDDKDSYKAEHRQQLRDWVKGISPGTQSTSTLNSLNNHDAFEWLIIHVVIPDTRAASEPRWKAAKADPDELAERSKSKAKWANKSNTTVFDKLRADFPPASKSGAERVAQIRLPKENVPQALLPATAVASEFTETPQERLNAWQDIVAKFKTSILQSFDRRVTQYEDDIRAKESQRSLPGWNFCTFFTLKESLAIALENVGLAEDALAIYDELEAVLDAMSNSAMLGDMAQVRAELERLADKADAVGTNGNHNEVAEALQLTTLSSIDQYSFRQRIVSSTISLFDFHTYIFSRQKLLIYRLGEYTPAEQATSGDAPSQLLEKQLIHIAEVCRRAALYVSANARILRGELHFTSDTSNKRIYDELVQVLAVSWVFSTCTKLLEETSVPIDLSATASSATSSGSQPKLSSKDPAYQQSLLALANDYTSANGKVVYRQDSLQVANNKAPPRQITAATGASEIAAARSELYLIQRRFLEVLASTNSWPVGWTAIAVADSTPEHDASSRLMASCASIVDSNLASSITTLDAFRLTYAELTSLAIHMSIYGNRLSLAENLFSDLALVRYQRGDLNGAAQILSKLLPKYLNNKWSDIDRRALLVYSSCLHQLRRKEEYFQVALALLQQQQKDNDQQLASDRDWANGASVSSLAISLQDVIDFSKDMQRPYRAPLGEAFEVDKIDTTVRHDNDRDGFDLQIVLNSLIANSTNVDRVKVRLVNLRDTSQEIWLETRAPVYVTDRILRADVSATSTSWGLFSVRQIVVELGNLHFARDYEPSQKPVPAGFSGADVGARRAGTAGAEVMVYPRDGSLAVTVAPCPDVHVDKARSLFVKLDTGSIAYDSIMLRFKPATAGLRLHSTKIEHATGSQSGTFSFSSQGIKLNAQPHTSMTYMLPYALDVPQLDLVVKVDVLCTKGSETFTFMFEEDVAVDLHLDVDVNDTFKPDYLYSQFSIRTTSDDPLIIDSVTASGSGIYSVTPLAMPAKQPVFDKQPVSLTCRIDRTELQKAIEPGTKGNGLEMKVAYYSWASVAIEQIKARLDTDLANSEYASFRRLLLPLLSRALTEVVTSRALETSILLSEFEIPSYDSIGWDKYLSVLTPELKNILCAWLKQWHGSHSVMTIDIANNLSDQIRSITVPVDIPTIDVLATAKLSMSSADSFSKTLPPVAYTGAPVQADLSIAITKRWSSSPQAEGPPVRLMYTIHETPDWIVAGASTATCEVTESDPAHVSLLLIPLAAGLLSLPHIDVQLVPTSGANDQKDTPVKGRYACETNYESAAETILVLRPPGDPNYTVVESLSTPHIGGPVIGLGVKLDSLVIDDPDDASTIPDDQKWWLTHD